jgi:hypothetical protein
MRVTTTLISAPPPPVNTLIELNAAEVNTLVRGLDDLLDGEEVSIERRGFLNKLVDALMDVQR